MTPAGAGPGHRRRSASRWTSCAPARCAACSTARPPSPSTGTTAPASCSTCRPSTATPRPSRWSWLAATHWLGRSDVRRPGRQTLQVIDEAWAAVRHGAGYFQSSLKLSRAHGVATVLVCHRPSDLTAQNDDGTASAKIAAGLLSDIQTRVLLRQPPEAGRRPTAELFDLSEREQRCWLGLLDRAERSGRSGARSAVVQTVLTPIETRLFDTDQRWRPDGDGGVMAAGVTAALADRRRPRPHPPRRAPRPTRRGRRTCRPGPPLALPGRRPRRPPGVGDDAHRPPRPRTVAMLVRRPPRRRHRPRRAAQRRQPRSTPSTGSPPGPG